MLNADLVPWVPSRGSLGASGDLAPSAHLVLAMMGEGELLGGDGRARAGRARSAGRGLAPVTLEAKEGLSLLNGTQFMAAIGCLAVADGEALLDSADLIGAMSLEGLRASVGPFQERIQLLRPIPGQLHTARHVRAATAGSEIMLSHLNCDKVQDAYSLRCIPQVHGACRDALRWLRRGRSPSRSTPSPTTRSCSPTAARSSRRATSTASRSPWPSIWRRWPISEIANISERRIFRMLTSSLSRAAAVPDHRQRPQQRLHDRPVHGRRAGRREQDPVPPGERRLHPELGRPGRPREHGHDGGAEARGRDAQRPDRPGHRGAVRGAGHRPAGAAPGRCGHQGRARPRQALRADARSRPLPGARDRGGGARRRRRPVRRRGAARDSREDRPHQDHAAGPGLQGAVPLGRPRGPRGGRGPRRGRDRRRPRRHRRVRGRLPGRGHRRRAAGRRPLCSSASRSSTSNASSPGPGIWGASITPPGTRTSSSPVWRWRSGTSSARPPAGRCTGCSAAPCATRSTTSASSRETPPRSSSKTPATLRRRATASST